MSQKAKERIQECIRSRAEELDLSYCQITSLDDLPELAQCHWITKLDLGYNKITAIQGLDKLTQLAELDLTGNEITAIQGLDNLTQLTKLDLSGNEITAIQGLDNLTQLRKLDLGWNKITAIQGLHNLNQLYHLDLYSNQITAIQGLDNLTQLAELDLFGNKITAIQGLDNLSQLTKLVLLGNKITAIQGLDNLTQLTELYLGDNRITVTQGLEKLTRLTRLKLENNQIEKISASSVKNYDGSLRGNRVNELLLPSDQPMKLPQSVCDWGWNAVLYYIKKKVGDSVALGPVEELTGFQRFLIGFFNIPDLGEIRWNVAAWGWTLLSAAFVLFLLASGVPLPAMAATLLAPLLLTRTPASMTEGLKLYRLCVNRLGIKKYNKPAKVFMKCMGLGAASVIIKLGVAVKHWLCHPIISLLAVPDNFSYYLGVSRLNDIPELVPGVDSIVQAKQEPQKTKADKRESASQDSGAEANFSLLDLGSDFTSEHSFFDKSSRQWAGIAGLSVFFLFALFYRVSIKASALFYLPLWWLISTAEFNEKKPEDFFNDKESLIKRQMLFWLAFGWLAYYFKWQGALVETLSTFPPLEWLPRFVATATKAAAVLPDWLAPAWGFYSPWFLTVVAGSYVFFRVVFTLMKWSLVGSGIEKTQEPSSEEATQADKTNWRKRIGFCQSVFILLQRTIFGLCLLYLIIILVGDIVPLVLSRFF